MKKVLSGLIIILALVLAMALASCEGFVVEINPNGPTTQTKPQETPNPDPHVHTAEVIPAVEATCTNTGLTEGKKCSECNEILIAQKETNKISHNYSEKVIKESTVNEKGQKELSCLVCGATELVELPYKESEGLIYTLSDDGTYYTVGKGEFNGTELYIPKMYNDIPVKAIKDDGFSACTSLESIVIPNSVTSIGYFAFGSCSSLTSVVIGDSVTCIDDWAFAHCALLTSIEIPESVTSIGEGLFYGCSSLTSMVIPDSVMSIGKQAFYGCSSLASIVISDSVTSIGRNAFDSCSSLESVTIPFVGGSVSAEGEAAYFTYIFGSDIYKTLTKVTITGGKICAFAFRGFSSIESVVIGDSVTSIGNQAFWECTSLTSVVIGDSVASIGHGAFGYCESLTSVVIGDSVTSMGDWVFENCTSLTSIEIPYSVTSIGDGAFSRCSSLTIYCEAESQPSGWNPDWNPGNRPVVWGCKGEIRHTVTKEEFIAALNIRNFTLTIPSSDGTDAVVAKYTEDGVDDLDLERKTVFVDGVAYDLKQVDGKWIATPKRVGSSQDEYYIDHMFDGIEMWDKVKYDEAKMGYYAEDEDGSSTLFQFKNGVLVKIETITVFDSMSITVTMLISNVGTTVIDIPEFTIVE